MKSTNRRELLKDLGYAALGGYLATSRGYAANETITVGCIGTGGRCQGLMKALAKIPGVRMAAVCDVWDTHPGGGQAARRSAGVRHQGVSGDPGPQGYRRRPDRNAQPSARAR